MTVTLDTGQIAAILFVGVVVLAIGAVVEWLADNWRHRH